MSSWAVGKCSWGAEVFPDFPRFLLESDLVVRRGVGDRGKTDGVINLRLILVSGKTREFLFGPNDSAGDIAQHVFDNWPEDWCDEAVAKADILRLIYQGRFLHSNVTLGALGLACSKTTVMHLVPRENLPEPNSQGRNVATPSGHLMWNDDLTLSADEMEAFYPGLLDNASAFDPNIGAIDDANSYDPNTDAINDANSYDPNTGAIETLTPYDPNTGRNGANSVRVNDGNSDASPVTSDNTNLTPIPSTVTVPLFRDRSSVPDRNDSLGFSLLTLDASRNENDSLTFVPPPNTLKENASITPDIKTLPLDVSTHNRENENARTTYPNTLPLDFSAPNTTTESVSVADPNTLPLDLPAPNTTTENVSVADPNTLPLDLSAPNTTTENVSVADPKTVPLDLSAPNTTNEKVPTSDSNTLSLDMPPNTFNEKAPTTLDLNALPLDVSAPNATNDIVPTTPDPNTIPLDLSSPSTITENAPTTSDSHSSV